MTVKHTHNTLPEIETQADDQRVSFAHPAEESFARILDYYGIQWVYEPRTFELEWDEQGNVLEALTPDFYLPRQDLFIELTTLRPKLNTKKNRKLRKMGELHPEINIKLFKRREIRNLMIKYGLLDEAEEIVGDNAQNNNSKEKNE